MSLGLLMPLLETSPFTSGSEDEEKDFAEA